MNRHQSGFSLISLMVGTVISLVGILALLSLYKNVVGTSVVSLTSAKQDAQIAGAQLTAQKELLNAGFGLEAAKVKNQFKLLSGASLSSNVLTPGTEPVIPTLPITTLTGDAEGNAVIWSYSETPVAPLSLKCAGLLVQRDSVTQQYALYRLQSTAGCTQTLSVSGITWSSTLLITQGQDSSASGAAQPFAARLTTCWPFNRSANVTSNVLQVTFRTRASSVDSSGQALLSTNTVCLPNISG